MDQLAIIRFLNRVPVWGRCLSDNKHFQGIVIELRDVIVRFSIMTKSGIFKTVCGSKQYFVTEKPKLR